MVSHSRTASRRTLASVLTGALIAGGVALGAAAPAQAAEADVDGATFSWGLRDSWRNYIAGPIAQGSITPTAPTTLTGGVANWSGGSGSIDDATFAGEVSFTGSVTYQGHDHGDGPLLDLTTSNPTIEVSGSTATLYFDVESTEAPGYPFPAVSEVQMPFATFTLPAPTVTDSVVTWTTGQGALTPEALPVFGGMYDPSPYTDPITISLPFETPTVATPTVNVSKTSGLTAAGETITVSGSGFLPNPPATNGTRPPLAGQFSGSYVVFGKFLDVWKPSEGAPSSARKIITQKWALPEASHATVGGAGAGAIALQPDGTFSAELTVSTSEANDLLEGNYGIYTYSGSGATYAAFETFTPLTFAAPTGAEDIIVDVPTWVDEETGAFGWAFASASPADLGVATQQGSNFVANGSLTEIIVTDDRAGGTDAYTWSISGSVGDFASSAGSFAGSYLGWTPKVVEGGAGVAAGAAVTSSQLGGVGLGAASELASSTAAQNARVGADLQLVIPGSTPAGDYTAKLTITALS